MGRSKPLKGLLMAILDSDNSTLLLLLEFLPRKKITGAPRSVSDEACCDGVPSIFPPSPRRPSPTKGDPLLSVRRAFSGRVQK